MKTRKKIHHYIKINRKKKTRRVSGKTGLPPGTLVHIGETLTEAVTLHITEYNAEQVKRTKIDQPDQLDLADSRFKKWIEVQGLHETPVIENIGNKLGINLLTLEDILNTEHRPKFEMQDSMLFLTLKAFSLKENEIEVEQVSFVLGPNFVATFQESNKPWFDAVQTRMQNPSGKIRQLGSDYLLYALTDVIVDQYYSVGETIGDRLEEIDDLIYENPTQELQEKNRLIKKEIISLRKYLLPALEAVSKLIRHKPDPITKETLRFFDDVNDHLVQIIDDVDTYRDISSELNDNYLSNLSYKMNQIIKLLTIISTIFIPLTFIAGVYGMNFHFIPELEWKYGYFSVIAAMVVLVSSMLIYFRRKRWI